MLLSAFLKVIIRSSFCPATSFHCARLRRQPSAEQKKIGWSVPTHSRGKRNARPHPSELLRHRADAVVAVFDARCDAPVHVRNGLTAHGGMIASITDAKPLDRIFTVTASPRRASADRTWLSPSQARSVICCASREEPETENDHRPCLGRLRRVKTPAIFHHQHGWLLRRFSVC